MIAKIYGKKIGDKFRANAIGSRNGERSRINQIKHFVQQRGKSVGNREMHSIRPLKGNNYTSGTMTA